MKTSAQIIAENKAWIEEIFEKFDKKYRKIAVRSKGMPADGVDENGRHKKGIHPSNWTSGFFGGLNAMMYEYTKAEEYIECAKACEKTLDEAIAGYPHNLHHDVGFQWHILSGVLSRITGDKASTTRNLLMASTLSARFNIDGSFITAWNGKAQQNWTIIDTLMNLPLLYWASDVSEDDRYKRVAMAHADTALCDHLRDDGSVAHIVEHDRETGEPVKTYAGQGYAEGSTWSRGQSWAVYGFVLSYIHTKEERYLNGAKQAANYFIANCSDDWLPRIDFRAPAEPVYYDATAGMITACGLIELGKLLPENEGGMYTHAALKIMRALCDKFADFNEEIDYVMNGCSVRYPIPGTYTEAQAGVHISIIYGDYFLAEALLKLKGSEFLPW